ncbi:MAG: TolC family outer membrane protein [Alphaproteobacteria bacterium]|nr:MAG: TolC family outer membrane protein [Alphaproteobacteria bacterium]
MGGSGVRSVLCVAAVAAALAPSYAVAETLESALAQAYRNNPTLNAQRAALRAIDESVPQALANYRPRVTGSVDSGYQHFESISTSGGQFTKTNTNISPRGGTVGLVQPVFNGMRSGNLTRQAEASVLAGRETLRNAEQTALLDGATAYMNVLRDTAILDLQRRNVQVLQEQLKQARDRFNVGEVTRTDVAQAEARLAQSQSQVLAAEANLKSSQATYRRVIGAEPVNLRPGMPVDRLSPRSLEGSIDLGRNEHPTVTAAQYTVDAAQYAVKSAEGSLYPTVTLEGAVVRRWDVQPGVTDQMTGTVLGRVAVPIYQGGSEYSIIRQQKETLGQRRIELDVQRDLVRATVVQAWSQLEATKAQIIAAQAQVTATEVALNGVREEARVGQRTTLDVLNAQQELVNARVALVTAQRDRVVASFTLLSAVGRLAPQVLKLPTETYDPRVHYHQVRDKWIGVRTPDGR